MSIHDDWTKGIEYKKDKAFIIVNGKEMSMQEYIEKEIDDENMRLLNEYT